MTLGSGPKGGVPALLRRNLERFERRDERAFLPAALEVTATPPSPLARGAVATIALFLVIAFLWSAFGKVDIIASAPGRLTPAGKVRVVQPLEAGTVKAILVGDGDTVRAGQLLIQLDPTAPTADRDQLARDLALAEADVARLRALRGGGESFHADAVPGQGAEAIEQARAALVAQRNLEAAKVSGIDEQIAAKRAEAAEADAELAKTSASLPILAEKARLRQTLKDKGFGTSFALLDAQQQLSDARRDLAVLADRGAQARATVGALQRQRSETSAQFASGVLGDLVTAEAKESQLRADLTKAEQRQAATDLRAPIDGVVQDLAVHTIGGVVSPAETLLRIVPEYEGLMVEARLANQDAGFVQPGQLVEVKVEAYNFTRYGLIPGRVMSVSRDTASETTDAQGQRSAQPQNPNGAYIARIRLDRTWLMVDGRRRPLGSGMAVTAEIRTGRRTVLSYLLSPVARKSSEAMRER
ncbi:MAG: HlyD family type I secretion periplasmic adaptor subunit [Caulobacteraceae bacterium]|nr:HlyD family type I secretion periplasmic adaptor subunit [Caulobacteraceae bacterium]